MYHLESRVRAGHHLPERNCPLAACKARATVSTWQNRSNITSSLLGSVPCWGCGPASHGHPCGKDVQQQGRACGQSSERDLAPLSACRGRLRMAVGRVCPGTPRRCWTNASSPAAPGRPRGPSPFVFRPDALQDSLWPGGAHLEGRRLLRTSRRQRVPGSKTRVGGGGAA